MKIAETIQPKLARGCRLAGDDTLLIPEGVLRLKGTGAEILRRCDGQRTVAEIVEELRGRYAGVVEKEVVDFLEKLIAKGVLVCDL